MRVYYLTCTRRERDGNRRWEMANIEVCDRCRRAVDNEPAVEFAEFRFADDEPREKQMGRYVRADDGFVGVLCLSCTAEFKEWLRINKPLASVHR